MWKRGQKRALAQRVALSPQFIGDLVARRRRAAPAVAILLEDACADMGLDIDRQDWANPQWSDSPYFEGRPQLRPKRKEATDVQA